ncbi:MAG TPA: septum formation family protein [Pseudonocardiaceae bacterium]|nr:septum formation family protein [Pseudonocardiaceae bacterium]
MRRMLGLMAALAMAGLLSTGCADGTGDVEAGDCFRDGTAAAFGWGTEVDCDRPHTVEVFAVRDVSATLGQFPRSALDTAGNPARQQYLALVTAFCEPAWSEYTGYGDLAAALAPDAVVLPALYGDMALEAAPAQEWERGNHIVICYQVFGQPATPGEEPLRVDSPVLSTVNRDPGAVPAQVRDCASTSMDGQGEQRVLCTTPHDREYLGHLDLAQFVGRVPGLDQAFLDRFDTATAPAQDWAVLDGLCARIFPPVLGGVREDIMLLAQVYTGDKNWGWTDGGPYHAACFAQTKQQTTRSVVAIGDEPLALTVEHTRRAHVRTT